MKGGGNEAFGIQQENKMFKTLIHLGFRTTVSNYSHGNLVKAMVFQAGERQHSAITMLCST